MTEDLCIATIELVHTCVKTPIAGYIEIYRERQAEGWLVDDVRQAKHVDGIGAQHQ